MVDSKGSFRTREVRRRAGELVKPAEIVGIGGIEAWTLADRRTWNLLLANAWSDRLEDPAADFTLRLAELRGEHDSNDRLRACLRKLQQTLVTARLPDGEMVTVQMLGGTNFGLADRSRGELKYEFSPRLVPLLRRSEIYARMEVKVLSAFTSRYGLSLYEILASRINLRKTTEQLDIETLRQWLGVVSGRHTRWPDFRRFVLEIAVREVNALSPIAVTAEPIKEGRKFVSVRLTWSRKPPFSPEEAAAALEVNRHSTGRAARLADAVERPVIELSEKDIQKGYAAAAPICRIDKYAVYRAWQSWVASLDELPGNPVGHWIDFCKKRAEESRP